MIERSNKLQLHYYFRDSSHSINAIIRNECEKEILQIIEEIANSLSIEIRLETEPPQDGGFKEIWEFIGNNSAQIALIVSVATILISRFPVENKKLTQLQIENLELDNAIKKKELQRLNLEFIQEENLNEKLIKDTIAHLQKNYKIAWRKSNFYKKLDAYPKIDHISVQRFIESEPVGKERVVFRKEFPSFILKSDDLPERNVPNVKIDVISPAIKPGNFKWKGFYEKEIIDFEMTDEIFRSEVLKGNVHFSNSFSIEGDMTQKRKIDQNGSIKVTKSTVTLVTAKIEGGKRIETEHGKRIKQFKA